MSPRLIAIPLAAVLLLAPAARAAPDPPAGPTCVAAGELPLDWFASSVAGAGNSSRAGHGGATAYSYLPGRTPTPRLGRLMLSLGPPFGPVRAPHGSATAAEKTYTIVERAGREPFERPLPRAAFLFASAVCGIGGLAWWRCQSRGDP